MSSLFGVKECSKEQFDVKFSEYAVRVYYPDNTSANYFTVAQSREAAASAVTELYGGEALFTIEV